MPELPEVETTLAGIKRPILGKKLVKLILRHTHLRWSIPTGLNEALAGQTLEKLQRRAKYLLFQFKTGTLILHLGMSGRLHLLKNPPPAGKHDHVDLQFANGYCLRFTDPRRFGALLFTQDPDHHPLLARLGPEPLSDDFDGKYLYERSRGRKVAIKSFIMDSKILVGVGNIYAAEALFIAKIHPQKAAGQLSRTECQSLSKAIKKILTQAIEKGGTTLKDFLKPSGQPGYFNMALQVYGKAGLPCPRCCTRLKSLRIGQRGTVYCPNCQK